jgi:hypothetical protein
MRDQKMVEGIGAPASGSKARRIIPRRGRLREGFIRKRDEGDERDGVGRVERRMRPET